MVIINSEIQHQTVLLLIITITLNKWVEDVDPRSETADNKDAVPDIKDYFKIKFN